MGFYLVPEDYENLPEVEKRAVIPICVADTDGDGQHVPREWFDQGVKPVAKRLAHLAEFHLCDPWRGSELAERVVHKLARKHGSNLGAKPWQQVVVFAQWEVKTLAAGGDERSRRRPHLPLTDAAAAKSESDENKYIRDILIQKGEKLLTCNASFRKAWRLFSFGWSWPEIHAALGLAGDKKTQRAFERAFQRCVKREIAEKWTNQTTSVCNQISRTPVCRITRTPSERAVRTR